MVCRISLSPKRTVALIFPIVSTWWPVTPVRAIGFSRTSVSPYKFSTLIKISVASVSNNRFIRPFFISLIGNITSLRPVFAHLSITCVIWCSLAARVFHILSFSFSSSLLAYDNSSLSLCCLFCLISIAVFTHFVLRSVSRFACCCGSLLDRRSIISTHFFYIPSFLQYVQNFSTAFIFAGLSARGNENLLA